MATATATKPRAKALRWKDVTRQPTGTHPMDSGGANGRHWQRPLPKRAVIVEGVTGKAPECSLSATISLTAFLDEHFEIDQRLTRWLRRECSKQGRWGYQAYAEMLAEKLGLAVLSSDYTYNWENDLSQDFQFSVVGPADADWIWSAECYVVIETHNGADARGGFSDPVVCKPTDPGAWLDVVCGVSFSRVLDAEGHELKDDEYQRADEEFQVGYTSNPVSAFNQEIAEILAFDAEKNEFRVRLKDGTTAEGYFYWRDANGGWEA